MVTDMLENISHPCHAAFSMADLEVRFVKAPTLAIGLLELAFGVDNSIVHKAKIVREHREGRIAAIYLVREKQESFLWIRHGRLISVQLQQVIEHQLIWCTPSFSASRALLVG